MKKFSLGLAVGAGFGMVLSLFRDKNGRRLGQPIQDQFQGTREDISDLTNAIGSLQEARQELNASLPPVKKNLTELEKDIQYYQMSISRIIAQLQKQTQKISEDITQNLPKKLE